MRCTRNGAASKQQKKQRFNKDIKVTLSDKIRYNELQKWQPHCVSHFCKNHSALANGFSHVFFFFSRCFGERYRKLKVINFENHMRFFFSFAREDSRSFWVVLWFRWCAGTCNFHNFQLFIFDRLECVEKNRKVQRYKLHISKMNFTRSPINRKLCKTWSKPTSKSPSTLDKKEKKKQNDDDDADVYN